MILKNLEKILSNFTLVFNYWCVVILIRISILGMRVKKTDLTGTN